AAGQRLGGCHRVGGPQGLHVVEHQQQPHHPSVRAVMAVVEPSPIINNLISVGCGAFGGGLVGRLSTWFHSRGERRSKPSDFSEVVSNPVIEQQLEEAATEWAAAHGHSAARELVARKLRLGYRLGPRRPAD